MTAPDPTHTPPANPYDPPAPPWGQAQPPRPVGTDGFAIASLVTGILWTGVVAIGLGIAGLVRIKRSGRGGKGLAIAGIVLGSVGVVGWFLVIGLVAMAVRSDDFQEGFREGVDSSLDDARTEAGLVLATGDCIDLPADLASVDAIDHVDCTGQHAAEVVGTRELTDGTYPGEDQVIGSAEGYCYDAFADYVGVDFDSSTLDLSYLYPTDASWALGDRQISCFTTAVDGSPLASSVAGSGR